MHTLCQKLEKRLEEVKLSQNNLPESFGSGDSIA